MENTLAISVALIAVISIWLSPKAASDGAFFRGFDLKGQAPGLWQLTLSQVTTWIFARSLLNAAILGFYYGLWGALAYAAYYLSFLTGAKIIDSLRFRHGYDSVQGFLSDRFGRLGSRCYNAVVGVRLISEVFANVLVVGILFGAAGSQSYTLAVLLFALVTLSYAMMGGMRASLRTDTFQMLLFLAVLVPLGLAIYGGLDNPLGQLLFKPFVIDEPGPVLLLVALLQVWSYPLHDPVMMDRGLLADQQTTRKSFYHAAWISSLCILLFGSFGILAGANAGEGESMNQVLQRLLGSNLMLLFNLSLVVSAMSTLDSTLSSAAKLVVNDMGVLGQSRGNGRAVMAAFMLLGLACVFLGNKDLFSAVAVSGTASMYLAPVIFFSLWRGYQVPASSYLFSFVLALGGAVLYFLESSGHTQWLGEAHKYTKLLWISIAILLLGCLSFWLPGRTRERVFGAIN